MGGRHLLLVLVVSAAAGCEQDPCHRSELIEGSWALDSVDARVVPSGVEDLSAEVARNSRGFDLTVEYDSDGESIRVESLLQLGTAHLDDDTGLCTDWGTVRLGRVLNEDSQSDTLADELFWSDLQYVCDAVEDRFELSGVHCHHRDEVDDPPTMVFVAGDE